MSPFSYEPNASAMVVGVGLMGQYMAKNIVSWLGLRKLILVDCSTTISVGTEQMALVDFARMVSDASNGTEVIPETIDVTSEQGVHDLFMRHSQIHYFMLTAGISPKPLTPPEELTKEDVMSACETNLWGTHNVARGS